jgi:hypothetical protein
MKKIKNTKLSLNTETLKQLKTRKDACHLDEAAKATF